MTKRQKNFDFLVCIYIMYIFHLADGRGLSIPVEIA